MERVHILWFNMIYVKALTPYVKSIDEANIYKVRKSCELATLWEGVWSSEREKGREKERERERESEGERIKRGIKKKRKRVLEGGTER